MMNNPLTTIKHPIAFEQIKAEHIEPAIDFLLAKCQANKAKLENIKPTSYAPFFDALDEMTQELDEAMGIIAHLESVLGTPEIRNAHQKVLPKVSAFRATLPFSEGLYQAVKNICKHQDLSQLSSDQKRHLEKTLEYFQRHGAELDASSKQRLENIEVKLSELCMKFAQHVVEATDAFELLVPKNESPFISGLPDRAKAMAEESAKAKGFEGYRFTLQGPSYISAMTYLDSSDLREKLYKAYMSRATVGEQDNRPLIEDILALRKEKAQILGFENVADLYLSSRMVKNGQAAMTFVKDLWQRTIPFFQREHALLEKQVQQNQWLASDRKIQAWDLAYLSEKLRKLECDFDEELLRPYFEINGVVKGMFEIAHRLYGVEIREVSDLPTWHKDVKTYELVGEDQKLWGVFYADFFPREGKQSGAWMHPFLTGSMDRSTPHVGLICCNSTPPIDGYALLTHDEVETLFHEFGHLLHHLLTNVPIKSQAGTNVAWDFVELPSQIMENWCWEKEALDLFAKHYQDQSTIPDELFQKMLKTRTFRQATMQMRQLSFAYTDLCLHMAYDPKHDGNAIEYSRKLLSQFTAVHLYEGYAMLASFSHLFADVVGYSAGYYSYKWAEVLDADAFTRFKAEGLFSRSVGEDFRQHLLSKGDSQDPALLFENFMGRKPNLEALFERMGLIEEGLN